MSSKFFDSKRASTVLAIFFASIATLSYFATTFLDQQKVKREAIENQLRSRELDLQLDTQAAKAKEIEAKLEEILKTTSKPRGTVSDKPESVRQIAGLQQEVSSLDAQLSKISTELDTINAALLTTPEKALTVPLLQKDVDELKTETQRDIDSLRGEMTRGYDLNRWLIGLILAALIGTVINNAIQSKQRDQVKPLRDKSQLDD